MKGHKTLRTTPRKRDLGGRVKVKVTILGIDVPNSPYGPRGHKSNSTPEPEQVQEKAALGHFHPAAKTLFITRTDTFGAPTMLKGKNRLGYGTR